MSKPFLEKWEVKSIQNLHNDIRPVKKPTRHKCSVKRNSNISSFSWFTQKRKNVKTQMSKCL